jgi:cysteinyl-tRNA synthetase
MSTKLLGAHFDIHGGGHDLQFPHHENEIAQSEACTGEHFANYWLHNGFIRVDSEKMSKSLGNFFTIREVMQQYKAEDIRYFMLTSQYRSPLNYSTVQLDSAHASLTRLYTAIRGLDTHAAVANLPKHSQRFHQAMQDDFNTPEALSVLFDLAKEINQAKQNKDNNAAAAIAALMQQLAQPLGILTQDSEAWFKGTNNAEVSGLSDSDIEQLIEQRNQARLDKNWAEADRLRDVLAENKIIIEDASGVSTWRRA